MRPVKLLTQRGMMLLEVLIAVLVFSLGVLGMVMMQGVSSDNSINSEDRASAALLANDFISELWQQYNPAAPTAITAPADLSTRPGLYYPQLLNATAAMTLGPNNSANLVIKWNVRGRASTDFAYYTTQVVIR